MKAGQFIASQMKKAGLDPSQVEFKALIELDAEIPTVTANMLEEKLMTEDAAKTKASLKNHFIGEFLKGVDQNLDKKLKKLGVEDKDVDKIFEEKNFSDRLENALDKLASVKEAASKTTDKEVDKKYKDEIEKLNSSISTLKEESKKALTEREGQYEAERINDEISREFLSKSWSKNFPEDTKKREVIAKTFLEQELELIGAKIVRGEDRKLKLVQSKNPELEYFDSTNKKVNFAELTAKIMAENKLNAVSDPTEPNAEVKIVGGIQPQGATQSNNPALNLLNTIKIKQTI